MSSSFDLTSIAKQAEQASQLLLDMGACGRSHLLRQLALLIDQYKDDILDANTLDLEASRDMAIPSLMLDWLRLTPERIQAVSHLLQAIASKPDPLQQITAVDSPSDVAQCCYGQRMPLGTIGLVYESFPDLGAIAAGICIKSANALMLKGGAEASHSNRMIASIIHDAFIRADVSPDCLHLLPADHSDLTRELLTLKPHIKLIIPYGRPSLIQNVIKQATVPVLRTSVGNCYLYCSDSASIDTASHMILDSYQSEPDAVNAIEKVIFHHHCSLEAISQLIHCLKQKNFTVKVDSTWANQFSDLPVAPTEEWHNPLLNFSVLIKKTENITEAVTWINQHSNGHSNCIATSSYQESRYFERNVMSDMVYVNVSPRFERHPKCGEIALGIAKHDRGWGGPIVAANLTNRKLIIRG